MTEMNMLVLAGGFGTRLQSVVSDVPKALAPVGTTPFLHLQLTHWVSQGLRSFIFLLHHQAEMIIDYVRQEQRGFLRDCSVEFLVEPAPMGTGGALAHAVERLGLTDRFIVTNADTWLGKGIKAVWDAGSPSMAVINVQDASRYGSIQLGVGNLVESFREKNTRDGDAKQKRVWINAGLYCLHPEIFEDWHGAPFSLEKVLFPVLSTNGKLLAVPLDTDFLDIGVPEDYFRFCRWVEDAFGWP